MKMGSLSKREKSLLLLLAVLGLTFLSYTYLLKPLYDYESALTETLSVKQTDRILTESKLLNDALTRQGLQNAQESLKALQDRYPKEMPNEAINGIIADLYLRCGLTSVNMSLSTSRVQPEGVTAYTTAGVTVTLSGTYASLRKLIDEVEATDYIRIGKLSFSQDTELVTAEGGILADKASILTNISVYFEVIMLSAEEPPAEDAAGTAA